MPNLLLALIAGLLFPLAFAPYDLWPLVLVSAALGYTALVRSPTPGRAFTAGWLYGVGMFGFGISWLHVSMTDYGFMPLWMSIPFTALFAMGLALFYGLAFWFTKRRGTRAMVFAGTWLVLDWVRGWLLTGFPWLYAGYAAIDTPLAGLAPLGGVWVLTLTLVLAAATAVDLARPRVSAGAALAVVLILVTAGLLAGRHAFTHPSGPRQQVALVQGNIPQDLKWLVTMRDETQEIYHSLTANLPEDTLVIWPESAMIEFYQDIRGFVDGEGERIAAKGGALISGLPWRDASTYPPRYHNSVAVVGTGHDGVYHKQKLVPFGEYVPLESLIRGWIPFFDLPMSSFTPGRPDQPNLFALGQEIAPAICYEMLYPAQVAERTGNADVLLTISNDAWFGHSAGPLQHFQMTRLRALETGRWLLRGTNNGVTAVVDARGQVRDRLPQFERGVLISEYQPRRGQTPFMVAGVWPTLLLALAMAVLAGGEGRRRASR